MMPGMQPSSNLTVQLPADAAADLVAAGLAVPAAPGAASAGGQGVSADLAAYALIVVNEAATTVTLLDGRRVVGDLVRRVMRRDKPAGYYLHVRGPGGEATVEAGAALDETVAAGLLAALWRVPPDGTDTEGPDGTVAPPD